MAGPPEKARTRLRRLDPGSLHRHLDRLLAAAWALCGSRHDAEDLVQETLARVLRRPRMIDGADEVGYLLRALHNTHRNLYRARSRRPLEASLPEEAVLGDSGAGDPAAGIEAQSVFAAISALPEPFRDVLVAVDVAGLSYAEAGALLRVPTGTVMSRLYRARRRVTAAVAVGPADRSRHP